MESHSQHIPIIKSLYTNQKGKSTFILKMIFVEFFGATISYLFRLKCAFYIDFCIIYVAIISRFYIDNRIFPLLRIDNVSDGHKIASVDVYYACFCIIVKQK